MAQGAGKKPSKPQMGLSKKPTSSKPAPKSSSGTKVGISKPQRQKTKTSADKLRKKLTSGMVAKTEQLLGQRAGHLELIGKGRAKGPNKEGEKVQKGGTRKFG